MRKIILFLLLLLPFSVSATNIDEKKINTFLKIAEIQIKNGNLEKAEEQIEKILDINPEHKRALELLSELTIPSVDSETLLNPEPNVTENQPVKIEYDYSQNIEEEEKIFGIAKSRIPIYLGILVFLGIVGAYFLFFNKPKKKDDFDPLSGI